MRTEHELAEALKNAANGVSVPADLERGIADRRRRRTRRRHGSLLAAAAVVAVVLGGTAVVRGGHVPPSADPVASAAAGAPDVDDVAAARADQVPRAREVWPEAVATYPKKAADGFKYRPVTALGPTEILLIAERSFEKAGRLEVYDTRTRASRVLATMSPGGKGYYPQDFEVGRDYIAWYGTTPNDDRKWADFWVVPRQGGEPTRVGEVTGDLALVDRIGATGDHIVWSPQSGGVYRMPITGGEPEKVEGSDGLWLDSWPWARDVPGDPVTAEKWRNTNQALLVDLENGTRRTITPPPGVTGLRCSTEWCLGTSGEKALSMRIDGTDVRRPTGFSHMGEEIYGGRFAESEDGPAIYDLATGKAGAIGAASADGVRGGWGRGVSSSSTRVFYWNAHGVETKETCGPMPERQRKALAAEGAAPSPGATVCMTETVEPGDENEILNLAAVPPAG
ncbi:hypothetical protein [Microtetraspora malaysiensis]|uniref:hypothetical protein n=1 Tax=Microtetraspora malaysiensis TaxID=161358 RepID=UPI00082F2741|nr:hypothetical protein [Microtetraspora malaysiensis]